VTQVPVHKDSPTCFDGTLLRCPQKAQHIRAKNTVLEFGRKQETFGFDERDFVGL
jgi:hypothetical protein